MVIRKAGCSLILIRRLMGSSASTTFLLFLGLLISSVSLAFAVIYFFIGIFTRQPAAPGIRTLIVAQFFLSGVLLFVIGILSEYIYAIYSLVRRRPLVIERARLNFDGLLPPR